MRNQYPLLACIVGLCVFGCGQKAAPPTVPSSNAAPAKATSKVTSSKMGKVPAKNAVAKGAEETPVEPTERKSKFEEPLQPPFTDPFFPKTTRLAYRKEPEKTGPVQDQKTVLLEQIVLKGISGPLGRRLALINNYTFAAGESGAVRLPKGTARIEVLEVKERSAVIKVENDPTPREIFLRPEP